MSDWLEKLLLLALIATAVLAFLRERKKEKKKDREQKLKESLPDFVASLSVLLRGGMSVQNAWMHLSGQAGKGELAELLKSGLSLLKNGLSFTEYLEKLALEEPAMKPLCLLLLSDRFMGDDRLLEALERLMRDLWDERRRLVRAKMARADTLLLLPMLMMFTVILVIVLTPALLQIRSFY